MIRRLSDKDREEMYESLKRIRVNCARMREKDKFGQKEILFE